MSGHDTSKNNTDFVSWKLAKWASELTYDSLSEEAIHSAKLYLYDSFGCALGGSQQHDVKIFLEHARALYESVGFKDIAQPEGLPDYLRDFVYFMERPL